MATAVAMAQVESGSGVTRRSGKDRKKRGQTEADAGVKITERMQNFYDTKEPHDADLAWMRVIYRQIDLSKDENAPLYFPEDVIDGKENLFRLLLRLVVEGKVPAYEFLDGREVFTEKYQINVPEMLDRFGIYYQNSGGRNGITIEEADVPTNQVLNYYIIEKWEFDKRSNEMKTRVEAICPVLNKYGDFGDQNRYPMFWVKFDQLRPYLAQQYVFL
ncbi:MAG: gliding motility protein GldN, partial [Lachnospiraceae bacterium]|nr:gliding motility protein GldN [Lachnospiraceae bacterium]